MRIVKFYSFSIPQKVYYLLACVIIYSKELFANSLFVLIYRKTLIYHPLFRFLAPNKKRNPLFYNSNAYLFTNSDYSKKRELGNLEWPTILFSKPHYSVLAVQDNWISYKLHTATSIHLSVHALYAIIFLSMNVNLELNQWHGCQSCYSVQIRIWVKFNLNTFKTICELSS